MPSTWESSFWCFVNPFFFCDYSQAPFFLRSECGSFMRHAEISFCRFPCLVLCCVTRLFLTVHCFVLETICETSWSSGVKMRTLVC